MIITPLGHTEFLVDIEPRQGRSVRILIDSWLSDFAVGDMMERSVKIELDHASLSSIDAIYLSHAHTDHFDPYTLSEIYSVTDHPLLLLPITLSYLVPLIEEYLPTARYEILRPGVPYMLEGVEIMGHMFPQSNITNEDDVMMLSIATDRELLFAEIDTLPEEDDLEVQKSLYRIFTRREYETACYLATRNELDGDLPLLDLPPKKRSSFHDEYIASRKESMYFSYQKWEYEDFESFPNLFEIPGFVRGYIGQGMCYPTELSSSLSRFHIFPLDEIASMETDIARLSWYDFPQKALLPGRQYRIESATIETGRKECPIARLVIDRERSGLEVAEARVYAHGPLFPRDIAHLEWEKLRILDLLNTRFLPYWSASPVASLRSVLIRSPDGCYRIGCEYDGEFIIFEYSYERGCFSERVSTPGLHLDESYFLLDIIDFLDGRQELYSNFWHQLDPKMTYRLWTCLGANIISDDLVKKKYQYHFERAHSGESSRSFAVPILSQLSHSKK